MTTKLKCNDHSWSNVFFIACLKARMSRAAKHSEISISVKEIFHWEKRGNLRLHLLIITSSFHPLQCAVVLRSGEILSNDAKMASTQHVACVADETKPRGLVSSATQATQHVNLKRRRLFSQLILLRIITLFWRASQIFTICFTTSACQRSLLQFSMTVTLGKANLPTREVTKRLFF